MAAATNTDEYTPKQMPKVRASAKLCRAGPPNSSIVTVIISVQPCVMIVREMVAVMAESMTSVAVALRMVRKCSRTRRSEEHTSELQSLTKLVCRLLLEK